MKGGMKVHPMSALGVLMSDLVYICVVFPPCLFNTCLLQISMRSFRKLSRGVWYYVLSRYLFDYVSVGCVPYTVCVHSCTDLYYLYMRCIVYIPFLFFFLMLRQVLAVTRCITLFCTFTLTDPVHSNALLWVTFVVTLLFAYSAVSALSLLIQLAYSARQLSLYCLCSV